MNFFLTLSGEESRIILGVEQEDHDKKVELLIAPLVFTAWSIAFRDFLRLLYWFPHTQVLAEDIFYFFKEPFSIPDEIGLETKFRLEPKTEMDPLSAELVVWQPFHPEEPALSIQNGAALTFINVMALGLLKRGETRFSVHSNDLEGEEFFQYHGETRRIEDEVRASGAIPFWLTPEIQRCLLISHVHDLGARMPESVPVPLLREAEERVLAPWKHERFESLIQFISERENIWIQKCRMAPKESEEAFHALQNWIFLLNLLGFVDRYLAGLLPTKMPNPIAPLFTFLLEHYYITQWESDLWPTRRSALEETYRDLVPYLLR